MNKPEWNELSSNVIGACIEVHRFLGPGMLEKLYVECLCRELNLRGIAYEREFVIPLVYKGLNLDIEMRSDLVIERTLVLELKSVKELNPVYEAQLYSYLRLSGLPVGLLINFNVPLLKNGIKKLFNTPAESSS